MKSDKGRVRLIVCGTRSLEDARLVEEKLDLYAKNFVDPIIITGGGIHYKKVAKSWGQRKVGADHFAEQWAFAKYYAVVRFPPDFEKYGNGPKALHVRNSEMVAYCAEALPDAYCVAFWEGKSPGTKSVIDKCRKAGIRTKVIMFEDKE